MSLPAELMAKYEPLSLLGEGGMGVVYEARHRLTGQTVAIKLLRNEKAQQQTAILRFKQEAEAASKLSHPNVIQVFDFGVCDQGIEYLIMEFVSGHNLSDAIKVRALEPQELVDTFVAICSGLAHAHRNGVVHRDLKPSNILISSRVGEKDTPKIADFGIAKMTSDGSTQHLTKTGEICGSPLYMSPEQCMGRPADIRSDIYALGCVMYEAITGAVPNAGDNTLETIHRRTNEAPRTFTECGVTFPDEIERIVLKCLELQPANRYQSADELSTDLQNAFSVRTEPAKSRPKRMAVQVAVAIALACVVYVAYPLYKNGVNSNATNESLEIATAERKKAAEFLDQNNFVEGRKHLSMALQSLKTAPRDEAFAEEKKAFMEQFSRLLFEEQQVPKQETDAKKQDSKKEVKAKQKGKSRAPASPAPLLQGATNGVIAPRGVDGGDGGGAASLDAFSDAASNGESNLPVRARDLTLEAVQEALK